ncbi:MAG: uridine phosphorylase [Myxococcota bacterium]|jgi:uridine phosphorylase
MQSQFVLSGDRAYHIGVAPHEIARQLVLVGDPARALRVAARFERIDHEARHREYVTLTGSYQGMPVSVMGTGIGTDNVEIALVEAYGLLEFDSDGGRRPGDRGPVTVLRVGTSGGTQEDIAPGTLVITALAVGLDATGLYLRTPDDPELQALEADARAALVRGLPPSRFVDRLHPYASRACVDLVAALVSASAAQPHVVGITAALPGFYAASGRWIEGLDNVVPDIKQRLATLSCGDLRLVNVEMESSLMLQVCAALGWHASTICPVLSTPSGHGGLADPAASVEAAITAGLTALRARWRG